MKLALFIFDVFFALFWLGGAIAVLCGVEFSYLTVFCAMTLASLYNVREAVEDWFDWHHRKGRW